MSARVCLLSPAPLWVNPRLQKEADALHAAGFDVVVGYRADGSCERDDAVLATRPWRWHRVDVARARAPARWLTSALRQRAAEMLWRAGLRNEMLERAAYCRADGLLLSWAISQRADVYIAHTQPVLSVAARAAAAHGSVFSFDCEDLLAEEAADGGRAAWRRMLITRVERRYLSRAAYVSATSEPMASYLRSTYQLDNVHVWHNTVAASDSAGVPSPVLREDRGPLELAWISATVGPGRGLEDAFAALSHLGEAARLHIYGVVPTDATAWLQQQLAALPPRSLPVMHAPVAGEDIVRVLSRHDIGLSLDGADCLNRSLTVANKLFYYLHAGLACVVTDTPGHRSIVRDGARFGARYPPGDVAALTSAIRGYLAPQVRLEAQRAAWQVARAQYVWDVEAKGFLGAIRAALPPLSPGPSDMVVGFA